MDNNDKKQKSAAPAEKPHYYGHVDGVHVFHATDESHSALVGRHVENPSDDDMRTAADEAKKLGTPVVVVHGAPPPKLRHKIELKKSEPVSFKKSDIVAPERLAKAFLQPDQITRTDQVAHNTSLDTTREDLIKWGHRMLSPMKKDSMEVIAAFGHTFKVRKLDADLYQGWVEDKDANKVFAFEKLTMPELMSQLQSKLELYGEDKGEVKEAPMKEEAPEEIHEVGQMLEAHMKERGHTFGEKWWEEAFEDGDVKDRAKAKIAQAKKKSAFDETVEDEERESDEFQSASPKKREDMVFAELNEVEDQLKEHHAATQGETVSIPKKEMIGGMLHPETDCDECGLSAAKCICYTGLPKPRLEFDGKKVTIFFKSEWGEEDRDAYVDDLKRRAGVILKSKHVLGK